MFGKPDPFKLRWDANAQYILVPVIWGIDSATNSSASAAAYAAGAGAEIVSTPYTHADPNILVGGLVETEWGSNGAALGHIPIIGLRRK